MYLDSRRIPQGSQQLFLIVNFHSKNINLTSHLLLLTKMYMIQVVVWNIFINSEMIEIFPQPSTFPTLTGYFTNPGATNSEKQGLFDWLQFVMTGIVVYFCLQFSDMFMYQKMRIQASQLRLKEWWRKQGWGNLSKVFTIPLIAMMLLLWWTFKYTLFDTK